MGSILLEIWRGFRALPMWVQIWISVILVPVNMATIVLITEPGSYLIPVLAIGGMAPNLILMYVERGFSKAMAISHLVLWIPLLVLLWFEIAAGSVFAKYLAIVFVVNFISICFDLKDSWAWFKGDRKVPGR